MDARPSLISGASGARPDFGERWASLGPYYAMFPVAFARSVIAEHSRVGDGVLDPFAGRGTSLFCAREAGRRALGAEINPLGWIYGRTKLAPAPRSQVISCLHEIALAARWFADDAERLPPFFHHCFAPRVLAFLMSARRLLKWRSHRTDRTAMAFILNYLHGKIERGRPSALSNQMRQTKAMAPDYSIKWWLENGFATPPDLDPLEFILTRVEWRYARGAPDWGDEALRLGDCRRILSARRARDEGAYDLLLTSPPYRGVTSYYYDQWLRFWLLGESERPNLDGQRWKSKFEDARSYRQLLHRSFASSRRLLAPDATIYVRTDARPATLDVTREVLMDLFPSKRHECRPAPFPRATQTSLFGDRADKPGEMDIVAMP